MFFLIDKPKGMTSHDVVDRIREVTSEKKVGHAGTLDPNATGLLIVAVGRGSTKKLGDISKNTHKTYFAEIFLGETRDTDDEEGEVVRKIRDIIPPKESDIQKVLNNFIGLQKQKPPPFSAIKIKGKKAYELARKGKKVKLNSREIEIFSIDLVKYKYPLLIITSEVSSGTYIRSLARDIGESLGVGAYLRNLRRTGIGKCSIENAHLLSEVTPSNFKNLAFTDLAK